MTTWPWRKMWYGFYNIGRIQFPAAPSFLVYTDRTTGQEWYLTYNTSTSPPSDGFGRVGFSSVPPWPAGNNPTTSGIWGEGATTPTGPYYGKVHLYAAFEEPWLDQSQNTPLFPGYRWRLYIDNSTPGLELFQVGNSAQNGDQSTANERLFALNLNGSTGYNVEMCEIILSNTYPGIAFNPLKVTQTPNPGPCNPQTYIFNQQGTGC